MTDPTNPDPSPANPGSSQFRGWERYARPDIWPEDDIEEFLAFLREIRRPVPDDDPADAEPVGTPDGST